jgi:Uma2 family endonuclease
VEGEAELIARRIVHLVPAGHLPNRAAARIFRSLDDYAEATGPGVTFTDNMGFAVSELSSGRRSVSPDVAYFLGPPPQDDMELDAGPLIFELEVPSKADYGPSVEAEMAAKRTDYFEAGTQVVWDVDSKSSVIRSYPVAAADQAIVFGAGQAAGAKPGIAGRHLPVDRLFA